VSVLEEVDHNVERGNRRTGLTCFLGRGKDSDACLSQPQFRIRLERDRRYTPPISVIV
jgi:hypothetical protein